MRNQVDVYYHRWVGWVARAWPKPHNPCHSAAWARSVQNLADAWEAIKLATPLLLAEMFVVTRTSAYSAKDYLRTSAITANGHSAPLIPLGPWIVTETFPP